MLHTDTTPRRRPPRRKISAILLNLTLALVSLIAVYPFLLAIFGSLKTAEQLARNPAGPPLSPTLENYRHLLGAAGRTVMRGFANSVFISTVHTLITVLFCAAAAYAFTRFRFPGRSILFGLLIASMLVPYEINIPPLYLFFAKIGWLNTFHVQIIPGVANVLGMFMLRQYMSGLPDEVFQAARVDGAGPWRVFFKILLPMSRPALGAVAVLVFVAKYTDYLWPSIMVQDPAKDPVMVLLPTLNTSADSFTIPYQLVLAGAVIITIPMLIIFLLFKDKLVAGATAGAVRG